MSNFEEDARDLYFKKKYKHDTDDWEQEYFDAMEVKYDTDTEFCGIHLYYWDDEDMTEMAKHILDDLMGRALLKGTVIEDEENQTTVVVTLSKKTEA